MKYEIISQGLTYFQPHESVLGYDVSCEFCKKILVKFGWSIGQSSIVGRSNTIFYLTSKAAKMKKSGLRIEEIH